MDIWGNSRIFAAILKQLRMYKEINVNDKSLFEPNGLTTEPQGNMTLEEAYDFVMDKVRAIYDIP
ncbi:MAG: hypothetical protein IJT97_04150 [Bacteroidaceae bacterium]|nr:hypothetical protein [Bacteroidaceae bacterium]